MERTKENLNRRGMTDNANYECGEKQTSSHLLKSTLNLVYVK